MALQRVWIPSPNYSSRGGARPRLLVVHTAEGARTLESLGSFFANSSSGVSSHIGADDQPGKVGEYVKREQKAWTQGNANPVSLSVENCGFAAWTREEWMTGHPNMLANCAAWLAEESAAFDIPLVRLSPTQAQGQGIGVCAHSDLGTWGGNHGDPGAGFPWDHVLSLAGGAAPPVTPPAPGGGGGAAPPFPGTLLVNYTAGHGTAQWQQQMVNRGWSLAVDDQYGPASERVCTQFQQEKGLGVDGIVGPETWAATWNLPVT